MDRRQRQQLPVGFLDLVLMLNPQLVQLLKINQREFAFRFATSLGLGAAREPARAHEDPDVVLSKDAEERSQALRRHL